MHILSFSILLLSAFLCFPVNMAHVMGDLMWKTFEPPANVEEKHGVKLKFWIDEMEKKFVFIPISSWCSKLAVLSNILDIFDWNLFIYQTNIPSCEFQLNSLLLLYTKRIEPEFFHPAVNHAWKVNQYGVVNIKLYV